jgi:hypothetical protein
MASVSRDHHVRGRTAETSSGARLAMSYGKYTVVYLTGGTSYKLCRIWFGADGSYYVTSPYHPDAKAWLFKVRVNYALEEMTVPLEELYDLASIDDDERCLKLAHHPDGFVQFSGRGILSGKAADGTIRGIGVMSWPLGRPVRGPAFGMAIRGVEHFQQASATGDETIVFSDAELSPLPAANTLILEGHYFPSLWRRFVRVEHDGRPTISVFHPAKAVLNLKVLFASPRCALDGFIGLELYSDKVADEFAASPRFTLSGPTGSLRKNLEGQWTAESIQCMFPRGDLRVERVLDYVMDEVDQ